MVGIPSDPQVHILKSFNEQLVALVDWKKGRDVDQEKAGQAGKSPTPLVFVQLAGDLPATPNLLAKRSDWSSTQAKYIVNDTTVLDSTKTVTAIEVEVFNGTDSVGYSSGDIGTILMISGIPCFSPLSGGGGGGCASCCTCVSSPDLVHPTLPAGFNETVQLWELATECGDDLLLIEAKTADALGFVTWLGGKPLLLWNGTSEVWELDDSGNCTVRDNLGADKTSTSTITCEWVRDFVAGEEVVTLTLDAVVA